MQSLPLLPFPTYSCQLEEISRTYTREQTTGPEIRYDEVTMDDIRLLWYKYTADKEYHMPMRLGKERVEMHFKLQGRSGVSYLDQHLIMTANQQSIFYQRDLEGEYILFPGEESAFFEIELSLPVFKSLVNEDSAFLQQFSHQLQTPRHYLWPGYCMNITPQMHAIIIDMRNTRYTGQMKRLYLEAKMIELFLLQVNGYDHQLLHNTHLRRQDTDALHAAKAYIEQHLAEECSILSLAGQVGLNQKKLKQGFKLLFGHTIFGYVSHVRMEKAKQLLLDEQKSVGEVAELVGYQHQQHFAAAFRKKYGILPKTLKK
jgi:AraC-like DNA-binding protein